jgi:hypothetical protein
VPAVQLDTEARSKQRLDLPQLLKWLPMHCADEEGGLDDIVAALRAAQPGSAAQPPLQGGHGAAAGAMDGAKGSTASAGGAAAADVAGRTSLRRQRLRAPPGSCQAALAALKVQFVLGTS